MSQSNSTNSRGGKPQGKKNWSTGESFAAIEAGLAQSQSKTSQTVLELTQGQMRDIHCILIRLKMRVFGNMKGNRLQKIPPSNGGKVKYMGATMNCV